MLPRARKHGGSIERIDTRIPPSQALRINAVAQVFHLQRLLLARLITADQSAENSDDRRQYRNHNFDVIVEPCQHVLNPSSL